MDPPRRPRETGTDTPDRVPTSVDAFRATKRVPLTIQ